MDHCSTQPSHQGVVTSRETILSLSLSHDTFTWPSHVCVVRVNVQPLRIHKTPLFHYILLIIQPPIFMDAFRKETHPVFNIKGTFQQVEMCGDEIIITTDDNRLRRTLSCSFRLFLLNPRCLWKSLTVVLLLLLLCLITDYHCHLLSSICYCTNDEMNPFKQHLNRWQKPQLLQWLSPLISNHFSNLHQSHLLASTSFFSLSLLKVFKWGSEWAQNFQNKPLQSGRGRGGKKEQEKHNHGKQMRKDTFLYSEVRTKRYADVFSSLSFPGDGYVKALKALAV